MTSVVALEVRGVGGRRSASGVRPVRIHCRARIEERRIMDNYREHLRDGNHITAPRRSLPCRKPATPCSAASNQDSENNMNTASLVLRAVPLCFVLLCCVSASAREPAHADPLRIHVVDVAGAIDVTMPGVKHDVAPSDGMELPSRIGSGEDRRLGLAQGATSIAIGPNSDVEIPPAAAKGQLIARLVQHRGNVFYDVAPRGLDKLRVESPLLVAVVKGTQFSVAVQDDRTTISLFEGLLEIRTPDGEQVTELRAGEIAMRSRDDASIRILQMAEEQPAAPQARVDARDAAADDAGLPARVPAADSLGADARIEADVIADLAVAGEGLARDAVAAIDVGRDLGVSLGAIAQAPLALDLDVGERGLDVALGADAALGDASAGLAVDAGLDLGAGTLDTGLD